jgi:hypothetical protein
VGVGKYNLKVGLAASTRGPDILKAGGPKNPSKNDIALTRVRVEFSFNVLFGGIDKFPIESKARYEIPCNSDDKIYDCIREGQVPAAMILPPARVVPPPQKK